VTDYLGSIVVAYGSARPERTAALDARSTVTVDGPRRGDRYGARDVNVVASPQHELADVSLSGRTLTVAIVDRAPAEHELDGKSVLTAEGPVRTASGGLNFYDRATVKIPLAGAKTIVYAKQGSAGPAQVVQGMGSRRSRPAFRAGLPLRVAVSGPPNLQPGRKL